MPLGTAITPNAIGQSAASPTKPRTATTASTYAASSLTPYRSGFTPYRAGSPSGFPQTEPVDEPTIRRVNTPYYGPVLPTPSTPQPSPNLPTTGTPPDGYTNDGRPYWKNPSNPNQVTFQAPGTAPTVLYNPTGASNSALEQQRALEQQISTQNQAMSDWLSGAMGSSMSDYTNRMDDMWIQANKFLPAQYRYLDTLTSRDYDNQRAQISLQRDDLSARKAHAATAWDLLQSDVGNRRGTTTDAWRELQRYTGQQSGFADQGWSNTVADINSRRGSTTDAYNEALRWLQQQGGFADQEMQLLVNALNTDRNNVQRGWDLTRTDATRQESEAARLLGISTEEIRNLRTAAGRDIDLARLVAEQSRGTTNTAQNLSFSDAARARELADYGRKSQSTAAGSYLSRGHRLGMGRNLAAENAARDAANLDWTRGMNAIDASQQGAENSYVSALNAFNTRQQQANLGYEGAVGDIQYGLNQGALSVEAALAALENRFNTGQLGYNRTMGGLQNQVNTSGIDYQAALAALQSQYNQGQLGYQSQKAGLQNQLNQGGIDYTAALNSLNNQYGVGANNYNYAMAQSNNDAARIAASLSGLNIAEQRALFGNDMSLWNAQQGINQQQTSASSAAAQQWNAYMQQMMSLGLPAPTNAPSSPYTYTPPRFGTPNPRLS